MFLIVSSHDFEEDYNSKADTSAGQDWGQFQIANSIDMKVSGNPWIDSFLTAGLGCHRVHHLLPAQKSGWSNNFTLPIVKKIWEDEGYKWERTQHFFLDRFPVLFKYYLLCPPRDHKGQHWLIEAFSPWAIARCIHFIIIGFLGMGSI